MRIVELDYHPDSALRFAVLARDPWSMFLDSGRPRAQGGRYDLLVADPVTTVITRGDRTVIEDRHRHIVTGDDPFAVLRALLEPVQAPVPGLPFPGGAVGYFAYDLARRIERLPQRTRGDSDLPDMAVGLYDWAVVVDHHERRALLVGHDQTGGRLEQRRRQLARIEAPPAAAFGPSFQVLSPVRAAIDRAAYARAFARIKRYIREGDCYQVNFAQRFEAAAEGDAWDAYRWLRNLNPAPFSAFLRLPEGAVLSSSPERFLCVRGGVVETRPIKGTRPRSPRADEDARLAAELEASDKDRAENVMIVDLLRNDLGKTCAVGSVEVPELFAVESYATVHHLVSTVRGRLPAGRHALEVLRGCFPGGSITGAPKLRAMEIIEELESHRRGVYCGSIGYLGFDGGMDMNIAIRTLTVEAGRMYCWAGGGIVHDSVMEEEYQESLDKAAAMIALFNRTSAQHVGI